MNSLRFSAMRGSDSEGANLRDILTEYESQRRVSIELTFLEWTTAWQDLRNFATYGNGPDVSVVGSTWITPLRAMQVLRPFSPADAQLAGGPEAFLRSLWNTGCAGNQVWAIPWLADTRVIWFWRSALKRAGLDEAQSFSTCAAIEQTIAALVASGQPTIVGPTRRTSRNLVHSLAGWMWSQGAEIWCESTKRVTLDEPIALQAIRSFITLYRSLANSELANLNDTESDEAFIAGRAAVTFSGPWIARLVAAQSPATLDDLGVAAIPGVPFAGGSSLIVWQRSLQSLAAIDLIRYLTGSEVHRRMAQGSGQLPARLEALGDPVLNRDRFFATLSRSVQAGRALPSDPMWGVVEERLNRTLNTLWEQALVASPDELEHVLVEPLIRLTHQLNTTLGHS